MPMVDSREVMNVRQASQYLGISADTLYTYVSRKRIPAFKLGNRWKFKKTTLDRWMVNQMARQAGEEIWRRFQIPIYLYEAAAAVPERQNLENIRRGQFEALLAEMGTVPARDPDIGLPVCHPAAGAVAVGARKFLIACNVNLGTPDVAVAKRIARTIRFSSGGFRSVKAMGVMLASRNLAQVSINLTDFEETPPHTVLEAVRREAERYGVPVLGTEIVGLIPRKALEMSAAYFRRHGNPRPESILEDRIAEAMARRQG